MQDAAKREATTVGTISRKDCGRTCTYVYVFKVNDVKIQDDTSTCRTALTSAGCAVGAPVLVYYDRERLSVTALQEFGFASRGRLFMGVWMASCGLLLIGLNSFLNRKGANPEESEEPDESDGDNRSDVLHIAPGE